MKPLKPHGSKTCLKLHGFRPLKTGSDPLKSVRNHTVSDSSETLLKPSLDASKWPWRSIWILQWKWSLESFRSFWIQEFCFALFFFWDFFVASAFRPVWPGRCIWGLVCVPRPTRTLDQGGVEPRLAVSLRPEGHRQYHYSTDAPLFFFWD